MSYSILVVYWVLIPCQMNWECAWRLTLHSTVTTIEMLSLPEVVYGKYLVPMSIRLGPIPYSLYPDYRSNLKVPQKLLRVETPSYFLQRNPPCPWNTNSILWNFFTFCFKLMLLTSHGWKKAHHTLLYHSWLSRKSLFFFFFL